MKKVMIGLFILGFGFIIQGILHDPSFNPPQAIIRPISPDDLTIPKISLKTAELATNTKNIYSLVGLFAREQEARVRPNAAQQKPLFSALLSVDYQLTTGTTPHD